MLANNDHPEELLNILVKRHPQLQYSRQSIVQAYRVLEECYMNGRKLLIAGNGGSAADSEHIVGELMKSFIYKREIDRTLSDRLVNIDEEMGIILSKYLQSALPAIALDGHIALTTAYMNDAEPLLCFAQQVSGYGNEGDVLLAISTSGNSKNILYSAVTARAKDMKVIGLTGRADSRLEKYSDVCIKVPEVETYKVQELHLPV